MILCSKGIPKFDLIARMRYAEDADWYNNKRSVIPRLPMTVQIETFYTDLLEMLCIGLGTENAPRILNESSGDAQRIEIYYGDTGCEATKRILSHVALNEYGYCVEGTKIFIYGHTMEELKRASERFLRIVRKGLSYDGDGLRIYGIADDAQECLVGEELAIMLVPEPAFGRSKLFCESGAEGERMWVVSGCTVSDFENYLNELRKNSFKEYETNSITGNIYATYIKDGIIVDTWYTKDGYIRINVSRGYDIRPLTTGTYDVACSSMLTVPGATVDKGGGQMCLIFKLSDGRFIIIDSAIPYEYSDNIMAVLKAQAPDPENIVVASWLFTHNHGDHVCGMIGMCRDIAKHSAVLTVESFVYNYPGCEQASVPWQRVGDGRNFHNMIKSAFPDAKIYRPLPGNTFGFANMHIEILASHEMYIYDSYPNNTNACNVFYRITVDGQIINIPGDTSDFDHSKLIELYGDYLKCDILQASHHGGEGSGTVESAKFYAPKTIIFLHSIGTEGRYGWETLKERPFNRQLIDSEKNPNYCEHFVMSDWIHCLPLPYEKGKCIRYTWSDFKL